MDKVEIDRIADFLVDVREALCMGDQGTGLHAHGAQLRRIIQRLMEATSTSQDQGLLVLLGGLEHEARLCQQEIEHRLRGGN